MNVGWGVKFSRRTEFGDVEHMVREFGDTVIFDTREQAREYIHKRFWYIKERVDEFTPANGWKLPIPVKIESADAL